MAKELIWNVTIDGVQHRVSCLPTGNKYILHCDDDFLKNVYREGAGMMADHLEAPLTILDKECLFVVWDEQPDLVIDGVMLHRNIDYQKALEKRIHDFKIVYQVIFWCAAGIFANGLLMIAFGSENLRSACMFLIAGVFSAIYSYIKIRRLTPKSNGHIIGEENNKGANSK